MKKLIPPALLTAIGFGVFNEHVREIFMNQPQWLVIVEASIAYIVIGFLNGIEVCSRVAMHEGRSYIKTDPDSILGVLSGIAWPIHWSVIKPIMMISKVTSAAVTKRLASLHAKRDAKENA